MRKIKGNLLGLVIMFGVFAAMPAAVGEYQLNTLLIILIWIIMAVSYRLLATTGEFPWDT